MSRKRTVVKSVHAVNLKERQANVDALVARLKKGTFHTEARVLTLAQASLLDRVNIISKSDDGDIRSGVLFFTNDYCMGTYILHDGWVHCSMNSRGNVTPRPSIPDGKLHCLQDTLNLFYENFKVLETIEDVALYAVKDHSYNSVERSIEVEEESTLRMSGFSSVKQRQDFVDGMELARKATVDDFEEGELIINANGDGVPYTQSACKMSLFDVRNSSLERKSTIVAELLEEAGIDFHEVNTRRDVNQSLTFDPVELRGTPVITEHGPL